MEADKVAGAGEALPHLLVSLWPQGDTGHGIVPTHLTRKQEQLPLSRPGSPDLVQECEREGVPRDALHLTQEEAQKPPTNPSSVVWWHPSRRGGSASLLRLLCRSPEVPLMSSPNGSSLRGPEVC